MAAKRGSSKRSQQSGGTQRWHKKGGKVGSDPAADRAFGGKEDFGIPAKEVNQPLPDGGREKGPEQGTGPMRSEAEGNRVNGVGAAPGPVGAGSGGDLDPDFIGLDGKGGLANDVAERRTRGPDITEGGSAAFADGPPAEGKNEMRSGTHGPAPQVVRGSTVDRSGGDASTTGMGTGADSAQSTPTVGEISSDETGGP